MLLLPLMISSLFGVGADRVVVVCNCGVEAYREALDGVRQGLGRDPQLVVPDAAGTLTLGQLARQDPGRIYIAIGQDALHWAMAARLDVPIVGAMVLHDDAAAEGTASGGQIDLDVPARVLLPEIERLFPGKTRLGILLRAGADKAALTALTARARELGLTLQAVEVANPANLTKAFASLKGKVDLVLTLPDSQLYNAATVKPLVMASLEDRLPIVGFSAAFVRAGAAAGIFADFREAGKQAAESALRFEPGRAPRTAEPPRKLTVAVNQRVLRLLGVEYAHMPDVVVYR